MKVTRYLYVGAALFGALVSSASSPLRAETADSVDARLNSIEAKLQRLSKIEAELARTRSASYLNQDAEEAKKNADAGAAANGLQHPGSMGGCDSAGCCDSGCCDSLACDSGSCCETCCLDISPCSSGWYLAVDLTALEAHVNTLVVGGVGLTPDFDHEFSARVIAGYEGDYGFGVRGRYWFYDDVALGPSIIGGPAGAIALTLDMDVADLEATQRKEFCSWDLLVAGGVRYTHLGFGATTAGAVGAIPPLGLGINFDGFGPTVALEAYRPIGCSGLTLFGTTRGSLLYGDTSVTGTGVLAPILAGAGIGIHEQVVQAYEISLGVQYARQIGSALGYVNFALEAQSWQAGQVLGLVGFDVGFVGPTTTVGVRY